jgi:hypothetical protein
MQNHAPISDAIEPNSTDEAHVSAQTFIYIYKISVSPARSPF